MSNIDKLPRWDCRNERDQRELEDWTVRQLRLLDMPTADFRLDIDDAYARDSDDACAEAMSERAAIQIEIFRAIESRDQQSVQRLTANSEELGRFAASCAMFMLRRRRRGREVGEPRDGDYSDFEHAMLHQASVDVQHIRMIWQKHLGKTNRGVPPTAVEISARHNGLIKIAERHRKAGADADGAVLLANWLKNKSRRRR